MKIDREEYIKKIAELMEKADTEMIELVYRFIRGITGGKL